MIIKMDKKIIGQKILHFSPSISYLLMHKNLFTILFLFLGGILAGQTVAQKRTVQLPINANDSGVTTTTFSLTLKAERKWYNRPHVPIRVEPRTQKSKAVKYSEAFRKKFAKALEELGKDTKEPIFGEMSRMGFNEKQRLPDGIQRNSGGANEDIPEVPPHVRQQLRDFQETNRRLVQNGEFNPRQYLNQASRLAVSNIQNMGNLPTLALQRLENNYGTLSSLGINTYARTAARFAGDRLTSRMMTARFEAAFQLLEIITSDEPFSRETLEKFCDFGKNYLANKIDDKTLGQIPEKWNSPALLGDVFMFLAQDNGISFGEFAMSYLEPLKGLPCFGVEAVADLMNGVEEPQGFVSDYQAIDYMLWWTEVCGLPKGFKAPAFDYQYNKSKYHGRFSKDWVAGGNASDLSGYLSLPDGMSGHVTSDYEQELAPYELIGGNIYFDRVNVKCIILTATGERRIIYVPWNLNEELTITSTSPHVECMVEPFNFDFFTDHDLQVMSGTVTFDFSHFEYDSEEDFRGGTNKKTEHQRSFREFDFANMADRELGLYYKITNLSAHGKSLVNTLHGGWWKPVHQIRNPQSVFLYEFDLMDVVSESVLEIGKPNGEKQKVIRHPLPLLVNDRISYKLSVYDPTPHPIYNPRGYPSSDKVPSLIRLSPRSEAIPHDQIAHNTQVRTCTFWNHVAEEPISPYYEFHKNLNFLIREAMVRGHRYQCNRECAGSGWLGNSGERRLLNEGLPGSGQKRSAFTYFEHYYSY